MANLKPLVPNRESGSPWPTTTKHQRPATSDQRMTVLYAVLHAALDTGTGQSIWASQSARHHYPPDTNATPPSVIPSSCVCAASPCPQTPRPSFFLTVTLRARVLSFRLSLSLLSSLPLLLLLEVPLSHGRRRTLRAVSLLAFAPLQGPLPPCRPPQKLTHLLLCLF